MAQPQQPPPLTNKARRIIVLENNNIIIITAEKTPQHIITIIKLIVRAVATTKIR